MVERIENKVYTTSEFADILGVCPSTVRKWIKSKKLNSFRIPGSMHNKIAYSFAKNFCEENDIPVNVIEQYHRYNSA